MAAFDYASLSAEVNELLVEFGTTVTLVQNGRAPADTNKPWRGPNQSAVLPATPDPDEPIAFDDIPVVLVPIDYDDEKQTILRRVRKATMYLGAGLVSVDPKTLDTVISGDNTWRICNVDEIKPADVAVLYVIELEG